MNPGLIILLVATSLLAIGIACALMLFVTRELRKVANADRKKKAEEEPSLIAETEEVSEFLSKMKAATLIGASHPQKRIDDQDDD